MDATKIVNVAAQEAGLHPLAKPITLAILRAGHATPSEVARAAGVSRQLVQYWIGYLDWRSARRAFLANLWAHHSVGAR